MSEIINSIRQKVAGGQNLFRRSTIEKLLYEYDRLLLRNKTLEKYFSDYTVTPGNNVIADDVAGNITMNDDACR